MLIVQKFGGTSVADTGRIRTVAEKVKAEIEAGSQVAVVASAMAGETNRLVGFTEEIAALHDAREYDVVVSTGEQVTCGLLAMALQRHGIPARSWLGWQLPVHTDDMHGRARIKQIGTGAIKQRMASGEVPVVPGFQGLSSIGNRITTLGRGGSDTSAVALAAALKADRCDIYTDVEGVYTTDPRIVPRARKIDRITYEEMLEMASLGAKVLQTRSVELAMKENVRIQVRSSYSDQPGTLVVNEDEIMEQALVSGIAFSRSEAKLTLLGVPDKPGIAAAIFGPLAEKAVNVDMIVQNISASDQTTDMTFTLPRGDLEHAVRVLEEARNKLNFRQIVADDSVAKVSVVGVGMRSHAGVAQKMFSTLAERGINIQVISTSEIKVSVLIDEEYTELAIRALHTSYGLDAEESSSVV